MAQKNNRRCLRQRGITLRKERMVHSIEISRCITSTSQQRRSTEPLGHKSCQRRQNPAGGKGSPSISTASVHTDTDTAKHRYPDHFYFKSCARETRIEIGVSGIDAVEMMRNGAIYTGLDITENHIALTSGT